MKHLYFLSIFFFCLSLNAQVGINSTEPKATLDITVENSANPSSTDGLLIPRLDILPTPNPTVDQNGMLIFLTTATGSFQPGFLYWDATTTNWVSINAGTAENWKLAGNKTEDSDFFGTTNNKSIKIYTNNTQLFSFTTSGQLAFNEGIEIGTGSVTADNSAIAIGSNKSVFFPTNADGIGSIAIGQAAQTVEDRSIAIGSVSKASKANSIAIGNQALAAANGSYAIGSLAQAKNLRALSFGSLSTSNGNYAVSIGNSSNSTGESAIALGDRSDASVSKSIAIGRDAAASGNNSIALGLNSQSSGSSAMAFGSQTEATMSNTVALGSLSKATDIGAIAIGNNTLAQNKYSFAAGYDSNASGESSIAIGELAETSGYASIAIGQNSSSIQDNAIAIGTNTSSINEGSIAIGDKANATGNRSIALGDTAQALNTNSIALGNNAQTTKNNQLRIDNINEVDLNGANLINATNITTTGKISTPANVTAFSFISSTATYPDYVFENYFEDNSNINPDYTFKTLKETEAYVKKHGHLPNVASYEKIKQNGFKVNLTETSVTNLEKIEEHFLYLVELNSQVESLKKENKSLLNILEEQQKQIDELKAAVLNNQERVSNTSNP